MVARLVGLADSGRRELSRRGPAAPAAGGPWRCPRSDFTLAGPSISAGDGNDILDRATLDRIRADCLAGADPGQAPQSPAYGDLRGLPPLLLAAGARELLLDDARRLAGLASAAGVSCRLDVYDGMPHAFHATTLPAAATLFRRVAEWTGAESVTPA
ncbi:hypothetical protein GCM10022419_082820 [Nonomuraea rosea]|uniref:Alpha/beta hydrolase fold-3 domain-containing protein n=1 Tax=Nonomuraea rosea TaxID=638574 RepID=A0ABP6YRN7_9ACTN